MEAEKIFALDIGTRKILGVVMQKVSSNYRVLDSEMVEHRTRAMYDGQIHDVEAVAAAIQTVKEALEGKLQIKLETAAVAAAGRALKTARGKVNKHRNNMNEISRMEVRALEIEAVQQAQYELAQTETGTGENNNYICAGYSVVSQALEGQGLASLVGQVGSEIDIEVIANHIDHVVKLIGIDHVAFGSDFDGVDGMLPTGLENPSKYPNLIYRLLKRGYSDDDIEKICYKNMFRVWNKVEEVAKSSR